MANTVTSSNAIMMLGVAGLYPVPQQIQGWGVDEAFESEAAETAVVQLGVDGQGVAGYVPRIVVMTITLLANSSSFLFFDNWVGAMDVGGEILYCNGIIRIPAIKRTYTMLQGALTRYPTIPSARRVLMQRQFQITWMPPAPGVAAISGSPIV